jgi:hypothetical protein
MRKRSAFLWMLTLAVWFAGCDSNGGGEERLSAAEKILGAWKLTGVSDGSGDQTPTFQENFEGVEVAFNSDQTYTLDVNARDDAQDVALKGPYVINEAAGTLSLTVTFGGAQVPLSLNFTFPDNDTLRLSGPANLLNTLLGTTLEGEVSLTFTRT